MNFTQNASNAVNVNGTSSEPVQLNSDDATWILTSAFIIFTMQSGFGLVESGLYIVVFKVWVSKILKVSFNENTSSVECITLYPSNGQIL